MAKIYVFSTLANDQKYTNWVKGPNDVPTEGFSVLIKGGTGVANDRLITPQGIATEITDEELAQLEQNPSFQQHKKDGFITVKTKKAEAEKVAADMNLKDESAPMTHSDYASEEDAPKYAKA